jgi:hypothetical protein
MSDYGRLVEETRDAVRLAGVTITSPLSFIDLTLPDGYSSFKLTANLVFSAGSDLSAIAFALSADHGLTFFNDHVNYDSYLQAGFTKRMVRGAANVPPDAVFYTDGLFAFTGGQKIGTAGSLEVTLFQSIPPNAWAYGTFIAGCRRFDETVGTLEYDTGVFQINEAPIVSIGTPRKVNLMRMLPYGNDDCNPPTSGITITKGSLCSLGNTGFMRRKPR